MNAGPEPEVPRVTRRQYRIQEHEVEFIAIRAQGPGGQNVNKVSSAVLLRFDIQQSALLEHVRERLLNLRDRRISATGVVVIKAQSSRSQAHNRLEALMRLQELIDRASAAPKIRHATRPTLGSRRRRRQGKTERSATKQLRAKITAD